MSVTPHEVRGRQNTDLDSVDYRDSAGRFRDEINALPDISRAAQQIEDPITR